MAGRQCCESAPHPNRGVGIGRVETFQHLSAYVTASPKAKAAIILISDIFGFEAPNLRKLADKVAAAGYFVVVPDFFYGDPFVAGSGENPMAGFQDWITNHGPAKAFEDSTKVTEVLKSRGISAIGAAGFCWGAKVVVDLTKGEVLKAGVLLHPSFVTFDDIKVVRAPLAILGAEMDRTSPPELVQQFGAILSAKQEKRVGRRLGSFLIWMEALRTLAQTLTAGGSHGGSATSGGFFCDERMRLSAVRNENHLREPRSDLQRRGRGGYITEWTAQRNFLTEAAPSDAEVPVRYSLEGASLVRGRVHPPQSMIAMISSFANWNVAETEVLRVFGR